MSEEISQQWPTKRATPDECAQHFSITKQTLWRWRKKSDFPQPAVRGRVVLYDIAAIEAWLAKPEEGKK